MAESERTPLLDVNSAQEDVIEAHSVEHDGGEFGSELWFFFKTTIPVMAGTPVCKTHSPPTLA